jgi:AraC-like DNA-binding protein
MDFSSKTANPRHLQDYPDIFAVQQEHKIKDGRESYGPQSYDVLSVYLKGGPRYALDGYLLKAEPPFGVLTAAGVVDQDLQVGEAEAVWVLFLGKGLLKKNLDTPGDFTVSVPMLKPLAFQDAHSLADTIRGIGLVKAGDRIRELRRIGLLLQAISDYCGMPRRSEKGAAHREAVRLREMVSNLAFKPAAMSDIYARLSLSSSCAEQLFLKAFGVTPVGYRTQLRMARARELLVASRLDVKQVARRVGFGDPLYFSRAFRKHFGMPPSRLVREYRPNWTESRSPLPSPRSETV